MKAVLLAAFTAAALSAPLFADVTTVKTLFTSENQETGTEVTWDKTLTIEAGNFTEGVNVGDYIYITFAGTTDVIELKANGTWLPGTIKTVLGDNTADTKAYITKDMLAALKEYGLELCGARFYVKSVEICNDGFQMPEGAIWAGYFWIDGWNTMELFKTAFDTYKGQRYMDIYLSEDKGDFTNYYMKVLTQFEQPDAIWADNDNIVHEAKKAIVDLNGIDVKAKLAANYIGTDNPITSLLIQSFPGDGNGPYNITAVALREGDNVSSVVGSIESVDETAPVTVYNLHGVAVRTDVSAADALSDLPAGLYIMNGRKYLVK